MNLSMRWLDEFVKLDKMSMRDFSEAMTMSGSKVETFETEGENIENVVVGKILKIEQHPDADKLLVCQVEAGLEAPIQIVTNGHNIKVGDLVPVCLHGAVLPDGTKIKKGKLRGVESYGMFCGLETLGLTAHDFPYADPEGIFVLQEDCTVGQDIQSAIGLNDTTVEFEITSNRADCLSVIGLAREAAATFNKPLELHKPVVKGGAGSINDELSCVEILDSELCYNYIARVVKNVKIEPSPRWLRERLRASGVRPINNIVDITNYVMLEYGQPMHAFDIRFIDERKIKVRRAKAGESITTLDGGEHALDESMLVIADANKPVAVAGVMGGEYSGIMDDTTTIVFESASFNGPSVRLTAKALGIRTDSSARFEKGLDPGACMPAIERACELVEILGAGDVCDGYIQDKKYDEKQREIKFDYKWINEFLHTDLSEQKMIDILEKIDCKVENGVIKVPTFRIDLEHKADIAEEIARFYGYNVIESTAFKGASQGKYSPVQLFEHRVNEILIAQGGCEVATYSFISPKLYDKVNMPADSAKRSSIVISNPLGEDTSIMRTTVLPSMLEVIARNYNNRNASTCLYEIGKEYIPNENPELLPAENKKIVIGMYGEQYDFFSIKGIVEELLDKLNITDYEIAADKTEYAYHSGRCAGVSVAGEKIGVVGEIHPSVSENFGIGSRCYAAELDFGALFANYVSERQYKPLPKFPAVTRDLAIICNASTPVLELEKAIKKASGKLLESLSLFDVYQGRQIEKDKKSVAYNIVLRSSESSLTAEEAQNVMEKIIKALADIGASLRM